jgi:hypothetical protein
MLLLYSHDSKAKAGVSNFRSQAEPSVDKKPGATVKKRNGTTAEGEIDGTIVQKGVSRPKSGSRSATAERAATYILVDGSDVDAIDERGVTAHGYYTIIEASRAGPLDDKYIVDWGSKYKGGMQFGKLGDGTSVMVIGAKLGELATEKAAQQRRLPLLGSFKCVNGECKIVPAIQIATATGIVRVPIRDIVRHP